MVILSTVAREALLKNAKILPRVKSDGRPFENGLIGGKYRTAVSQRKKFVKALMAADKLENATTIEGLVNYVLVEGDLKFTQDPGFPSQVEALLQISINPNAGSEQRNEQITQLDMYKEELDKQRNLPDKRAADWLIGDLIQIKLSRLKTESKAENSESAGIHARKEDEPHTGPEPQHPAAEVDAGNSMSLKGNSNIVAAAEVEMKAAKAAMETAKAAMETAKVRMKELLAAAKGKHPEMDKSQLNGLAQKVINAREQKREDEIPDTITAEIKTLADVLAVYQATQAVHMDAESDHQLKIFKLEDAREAVHHDAVDVDQLPPEAGKSPLPMFTDEHVTPGITDADGWDDEFIATRYELPHDKNGEVPVPIAHNPHNPLVQQQTGADKEFGAVVVPDLDGRVVQVQAGHEREFGAVVDPDLDGGKKEPSARPSVRLGRGGNNGDSSGA